MKKIELNKRNSLKIDNDLYYYNFNNLDSNNVSVFYETEIRFIQFHFCLDGNLSFEYNNGAYSFPLQKDNSILLFNPSTNLPVNVKMGGKSKLVSLLISIEKFHSLFSETSDSIPFLSKENIDKKYYKESKLSPFIITILTQMLNEKISDNVNELVQTLHKLKPSSSKGIYFKSINLSSTMSPSITIDTKSIKGI